MSLPPSVKALGERADALMQGLATAGSQPAVQPPANAPAPATEAPAPAPMPGSAPTPTVSAPSDDGIEHRYKVLQGKYNAEVPRLMADNARLSDANADLNSRVSDLEARLAAAPKPDTSLVRPDEVEEYGQGMVDMVRRAAQEQNAALIEQVAELKAALGQVQTGVAQGQQLGFFETLTADHPDWAVVNEDESFHKWLAETDPLSGRQRQSLLKDAQGQKQGKRASAIFTEFKKTRDSWVANASATLGAQEVPGQGSASGGANPVLLPGQRMWTRAEVNSFYTDLRTGRTKGAEAAATEAEIQRAMAEGRIK